MRDLAASPFGWEVCAVSQAVLQAGSQALSLGDGLVERQRPEQSQCLQERTQCLQAQQLEARRLQSQCLQSLCLQAQCLQALCLPARLLQELQCQPSEILQLEHQKTQWLLLLL